MIRRSDSFRVYFSVVICIHEIIICIHEGIIQKTVIGI